MKPTIEELDLPDWEEFYACFKQVLQGDFWGYTARDKARFSREARVKSFFVTGKRHFWVAKLGGELVGFLIVTLVASGLSFVNWLGVKEEFRG